MSKMSNLHAELSEQAYELGFESLEQAEQAGYGIDYENARLVEPQEQAHRAWLAERDTVLVMLGDLMADADEKGEKWKMDAVAHIISFVEEAHD